MNTNARVWLRCQLLIDRRTDLDMTLSDMAKKSEICYTTLRQAEHASKRFTITNAVKIARAYGFDPEDVICDNEEDAKTINRTYKHPLEPSAVRSLISAIIIQAINDYTLNQGMRDEVEEFFKSSYFKVLYDEKDGEKLISICRRRAKTYTKSRGFNLHGGVKEGYKSRCL